VTATRDWAHVKQLFHDALDLPPDARAAFVQARAVSQEAVEEVMSLLRTHPAAAGFLSTPADAAHVSAAIACLRPGDRVGSFEIIGMIGAGGMGEVYRARDTRLDREVAIKMLPHASAVDAEGREQFEREARAISKLTHPRISTLYDVGSCSLGSAAVPYLVMELVDGETLAARLRRGALPIDQALTVGIEIAEALAVAHGAGVIHRDIKPANIMLTRSGVKLLDFGLARLHRTLGVGHPDGQDANGHPIRSSGIAGTLPYMAPEQLRGTASDARADLFAFGAVLYEMLAGRAAFDATSEADLIVEIVEREPAPLSTRQPLTPPRLERLIATCLAKDPDERWQTSQDLVRALRWVRDDHSPQASRQAAGRVSPTLVAWGWGLAAVLFLTLVAVVWPRPAGSVSRITFPVFAPPATQFPRGAAEMAVAPDGSGLVFVAVAANGTRQLWLRRFDATDSQLLAGTDGASYPFWSPDARWIGFFARNKLLKIAPIGGQPQFLCDVKSSSRGTWGGRTILFSGFGEPVWRVSEDGGMVRPATILDQSRDVAHGLPVFLPDGRRFLYLAVRKGNDGTEVVLGSLDSTESRRVFGSEGNVEVAGRYLISMSKGVLMAHPFDPDRAAVTGSPIEIANRILSDPPLRSGSPFSAGASGVIAYRSASANSRLLWFDRSGRELDAFPIEGDWHHPRLSPDEKSMLIEKTDPATGRHTIWLLDLVRRTSSRLISDPFGAHQPAWSPDGRRIVFSSNRLGGLSLFMIAADGSGIPEPVLPGEKAFAYIGDWSSNGNVLLFQIAREGVEDLATIALDTDRRPQPFVSSPAMETQGQFSPDGKWVAYTSDESGSPEVYVRHFPDTGVKTQISTHGGTQGRWRHNGKELFYLGLDGKLMAVDIKNSLLLEAGTPHALFVTGITGSFLDRFNQYVVTGDGQRFLINRSAEDENSAPITIVMNWDAVRRQ